MQIYPVKMKRKIDTMWRNINKARKYEIKMKTGEAGQDIFLGNWYFNMGLSGRAWRSVSQYQREVIEPLYRLYEESLNEHVRDLEVF